jgi:nucleoside-diphosphate-sugar epimerase
MYPTQTILEDLVRKALVYGAAGFIGNHMVNRLKNDGYWVRGVDQKIPEFSMSTADEFIIGDLRDFNFVTSCQSLGDLSFDEIYQFAADMGGAGYIFTGDHDAEIMHNSASINLNVLKNQQEINEKLTTNKTKIFYSSSACIYPTYNQNDPHNPNCSEDSAYPAEPDSEYGWEKLFSERLYLAFNRNHQIPVRIARYHNIFGPEGKYDGGREKAPAAICRKIAMANPTDEIEIWGDGEQTRSFLYIDECIEASRRLMEHPTFIGPINIGSEEMVTINKLVEVTAKIAEKEISISHIDGPLGVRGRNSSNQLIRKVLDWDYQMSLEDGISKTYKWICERLRVED